MAVVLLASLINSRFAFPGNVPSIMGSEQVRIAGIVLKWIPKEKEKNYKRAESLIREASRRGAKIVCTTESFLDGYSIRDENMTFEKFRSLAEPIPDGEYLSKLQKLSDELEIYLVAGLTELSGENIYNSAVLIDPNGKILGIYRKNFLWGEEKEKYKSGSVFPVFDTIYGKIGMMICYDRQNKESISELKDNGAELVFCPAGGGFGAQNDQIVSQRSREGKIPIVFVHPIEFLVTDPSGKILKQSLFGKTLDENTSESLGGVVHIFNVNISSHSKK